MDELTEEKDDFVEEVLGEPEDMTEEDLYVLEEEVLESYASELESEKWKEENNQYNLEPGSRVV
ncbi:MAG: hypothetical protein ABEK16_06520 [Candidatus Nanohalobium sp.]